MGYVKRIWRDLRHKKALEVEGTINFAVGKVSADEHNKKYSHPHLPTTRNNENTKTRPRKYSTTQQALPRHLTSLKSTRFIAQSFMFKSSSTPSLSHSSTPKMSPNRRPSLADPSKVSLNVAYFLRVEIDSCSHLAACNLILNYSDPFVVLTLNGVEFGRTSVVPRTKNPQWFNEAFEIPVFTGVTEPVLVMKVWDMDVDGIGDFLGQATYNVDKNDNELYVLNEANFSITSVSLELTNTDLASKLMSVPNFKPNETSLLHKCVTSNRLLPRSNRQLVNGKNEIFVVEDVETSRSVIWTCVVAIAIYFGVTYVAFSKYFENWTALECCYYAVVTFTTVGFGDLSPTTEGGRIFAIFHSFAGVLMIGSGFGILFKLFMIKRLEQLAETDTKKYNRMLDLMQVDDVKETEDEGFIPDLSTISGRNLFDKQDKDAGDSRSNLCRESSLKLEKHNKQTQTRFTRLVLFWVSAAIVLSCFGFIAGKMEGWSVADSAYFVMTTATSVGYGDVTPKTEAGMILCLIFCPFAVAIMSASLGQTINYYFEKKANEQAEQLFEDAFILDDLIHVQNKDTDRVTRIEFLQFMLILMKKVEPGLIDRLNSQFDSMDADGNGVLEPADLDMINNKRRLFRRAAVAKFHSKSGKFLGQVMQSQANAAKVEREREMEWEKEWERETIERETEMKSEDKFDSIEEGVEEGVAGRDGDGEDEDENVLRPSELAIEIENRQVGFASDEDGDAGKPYIL